MAINLPNIGQVEWGGELNAALTTLDQQTIVDAHINEGNLIFTANSGSEIDVGSVQGPPGEDGAPGAPGPEGPAGPAGTLFQTYTVESFAQPGDTSDTDAWARAVTAARDLPPGVPSQIVGTKPLYEFHEPVNIRGLKNCRIGGSAGARPVIRIASGAGGQNAFRTSAGMGSPSGGGTGIAALGDSLTEGDNWLSEVASLSGVVVTDLGRSGQSSTDIAGRAGALPWTVTLEGNVVPTTGPATVTAVEPASYWRRVTVQRQVTVALEAPGGDVRGLMYWPTDVNPNWRFVPSNPPQVAIPVPPGTPVRVLADLPNKSAVGFHDRNLIYWSGRNNMVNTSVIERDDAAVMNIFTGKKLILGITNATSERRGSAGYNTITEINRRRAQLYGSQFWDIRRYLIDELIYAMGIVPTEEDLYNMAEDSPPPSIMSDAIHFTSAASTVLGREMYRQLMYRGMVPYTAMNVTENIVFENIRFEGGASEVPDGMFDRRQARTFGPDYMNSAIYLSGHLTPTESAMGIVRNITVRDVDLIGTSSLPLFIRGCSNVLVTQTYIRRSLDTGFIWCKGLKFIDNRVEWSADNGVSLSQGCDEVVCANNTIIGSYYAGIHCGGWNGWRGSSHLTVSGNTIVNSRQFGISLRDGATFATVTGNVIDGVLRGASSEDRDTMADTAGQFNGTGILVTGYIASGGGTATPNITAVSRDITISGNSVRNCDRNGISLAAGVSGVTITGNTVRNVGQLTSPTSVSIAPNHRYYNVAIGTYGLHNPGAEDVVVTGNQVIDDRLTPATNFAVSLANAVRGNERSNAGFGTRNVQTF